MQPFSLVDDELAQPSASLVTKFHAFSCDWGQYFEGWLSGFR